MSNANIHLSVILPVYNSESFILRSLSDLDLFLKDLAYASELIIVDDGSTDGSLPLLKEWSKKDRPYKTRVIALGKNLGKGAGVARGMLEANGKYRIFSDADLAYPPPQILRILEAMEDGNDVAAACRVDPSSRYTISPAFFHYLYTRHLASRVINWALRKTIIPHCRDSQAGLKGFSAEAAEKIFSRQIITGFPFDIEAIFLAEKMGFKVREVPVEYRYFNEPTTVVFMQDGLNIIRDVFRIRLRHIAGRYNIPGDGRSRRLIVNADDFGMTLPISRGILKTTAAGSVNSISVMAGSPFFDQSMDELIGIRPHPRVGLHATLTWGRPLSCPEEIPTIVDKNGAFLSRNRLLLKAMLGRISPEDVYKELRLQCERLARRWPDISHIDGHHHVHIFPVVRTAVEKIAREFNIKFIRSPREGLWSPLQKAFARRLATAVLSSSSPAYWRGRGFETSDHFGGFSLGGGARLKERWLKTLQRIPDGITEIMVHPGYKSENEDIYNDKREDEVAVLTDPEIIKKIAHHELVEG